MNAVKTFKDIIANADKVESLNFEEFLKTGNINIKLKNLTEQEKEDLNHLRISNVNGIIFDDRK